MATTKNYNDDQFMLQVNYVLDDPEELDEDIPTPQFLLGKDIFIESMQHTFEGWVEEIEYYNMDNEEIDETYENFLKYREDLVCGYLKGVLIANVNNGKVIRPDYDELCEYLLKNPKVTMGEVFVKFVK